MQVVATLARAGLAEPVAIWTAGTAPDRSGLERLCRRHAERRAAALAPMISPDQTFGLPVSGLDVASARPAGDIDLILDFRGDGAEDPAGLGDCNIPRWVLRIAGVKLNTVEAAILAAYCSEEPAVEVVLLCNKHELYAGRLPKRPSFVETVNAVLLNLGDWYEVGCRKLLAGHSLSAENPATSAPPARPLACLAAWLGGRRRWLQARYTVEIWNIGLAPRPSLEALAGGQPIAGVTWLPHPPDLTFRADPFGWVDAAGRISIAHERFDYRVGKGTLEVARCGGPAADASFEPLADLPIHASYPYLMPMPGFLLCLPEVNESGRALLFKIETQPLRLTFVGSLLDDVPLSDGTIFRFGEHHWLFGTRADRDSQLRLYAWFSKAVDGPWTPHALNPIKCDITSARPAGTPFWAGGSLIRPAQDCSRSYGGAVTLNRILELTPSSFREETVAQILPDPRGPYPDGLHTLSFVGDSILIDGKRHVFRWNAAALNQNFLRRRYERQARLRAGASSP